MKILHISDCHGQIPRVEQAYDIVVCSGDLLPNRSKGSIKTEVPFQTAWLNNCISRFKRLVGNRLFIFSSGNHDYIDPCKILREHGINAVNIDNCVFEHEGISFYGFPHVPYFTGEWNFELHPQDMIKEVDKFIHLLNSRDINVLVAHSPPYQVLDKNFWGEHCGNSIILNKLVMNDLVHFPKLYLCGHIHEANGIDEILDSKSERQLLVSNAATSPKLLTI